MKNKILLTIIFGFLVFSCGEDPKPVDPIYEFISFKGQPSVNLNELANSTKAFPLVVALRAFEPYSDDIIIDFEVTGTNAAENTDFVVTPDASIKIPAGSFVSDTIFVKTIDNEAGSPEARNIKIAIKSVSKPDIKIGLGLTEPKNATVTLNILDDECSETISIFNSPSLVNTLDWGGGDVMKPAAGVVTGNTVKVTGDLIDYAPFSDASLTITLTPDVPGGTKGTAAFGEQETGDDSDGYEYKFIQTGEGSYDVCSGVINVAYDIYYLDGDWVYWYSVSNVYSAP